MRRQFFYTFLLAMLGGVFSVVVAAQAHSVSPNDLLGSMTMRDWLAVLSMATSLVFMAGSLRRQLEVYGTRITRLEKRVDEEIPATYVRKDVHAAELRG